MSPLRNLRGRGARSRLVFIVIIAIWPLVFGGGFSLSVMVTAGLYAIIAMSLGLLLGQAGLISLGQAAFAGIGAFTAGILTMNFDQAPWVGVIAGTIAATVVALIIGRPILRLKGYFLALATLGMGEIFVVIVRQHQHFFNGTVGIVSIPPFSIGPLSFASKEAQYYLVWFLVFFLLLVLERALRSRVGRALRALSSSETAASTLGVRAAGWKLQAFAVSAAMAGLAGGLFAYVMSAAVYGSFTGQLSLVVMIMVIVGGVDSLLGAVIGAVLMSWLQYAFTDFATYQTALYALVLLLLLLFLPGGLIMGFESRPVRAAREFVARLLKPVARRIPGLGAAPAAVASTGPAPGVTLQSAPSGTKAEIEAAVLRWKESSAVTSPVVTVADEDEFLRLDAASVYFGGVAAVSGVTFSVARGSITALLGPNGAGKTTVFNAVSALQKLASGQIFFKGKRIDRLPASEVARLGLARTFQNLRLFPNMTVLENVMVGRHRHEKAGFVTAACGLQKEEEAKSRRRSLEALAVVGLEQLADRRVTTLPYGQQRLVEIARALATDPELLLLDEPAAGMNATETALLVERIAAIRDAGVTVLLVEHDLGMVMGISDTVNVLNFGRLIASGSPAVVQQDPAVIEAYLGVKHGDQYGTLDAKSVELAEEAKERADHDGAPVLEVRGLYTNYGSISAIRDVSLTVHAGEIVAVLGSNGAGKTTMLHTISGLLRPRAGTVFHEGTDITRLSAQEIASRGVGHVPEGRRVFPTLSVIDNLKLGACCREDRNKAAERDDLDEVFDAFPRLAERRNQPAGTLSGGEQQMLAIGRGLMGRPKLLLLDEPSMGLAPMLVELIFESLVKLNASGLTLLVVEQNAKLLLSIAHHAFVLQTGQVALSGSAASLACDDRVKALYLGQTAAA